MRSRCLTCCIACAGVVLAVPLVSADPVVVTDTQRLDYSTLDYGDQRFLSIDVDGDGQEEFDFTVLNADDAHFLGGLDFTRNHAFVGDFDSNDNFVFRTYSEGDRIGSELEDDLGFELVAYGEYVLDRGTASETSGGGLASSTVYVGFGFYAVGLGPSGNDEGMLYGWMRVTFGELVATDSGIPSNTFVEVSRLGYASGLGEGIVVGACNRADLAPPSFVLDLADIVAFANSFTGADPIVDADGNGVFDLADIVAFVESFNAGCP